MAENRNGSVDQVTQKAWGGLLVGSDVSLVVDTKSDPDASREAEALVQAVKDVYGVADVHVRDLRGRNFREPLPYLATSIGLFRGLSEIRYFADLRRWSSTTSAA